jgi:hypothetical protein
MGLLHLSSLGKHFTYPDKCQSHSLCWQTTNQYSFHYIQHELQNIKSGAYIMITLNMLNHFMCFMSNDLNIPGFDWKCVLIGYHHHYCGHEKKNLYFHLLTCT